MLTIWFLSLLIVTLAVGIGTYAEIRKGEIPLALGLVVFLIALALHGPIYYWSFQWLTQ